MKQFILDQCQECDGLSKFITPDLPGHGTCCKCFRAQTELEQLRFGPVVFMQDSDADEPMGILDQDGKDALLEHLKQWDNGGTPDRDIEPPWGKSDHLIIYGNYVISYNSGLPTVALTAVYHPDPADDGDWREKLFLEHWESLDIQQSHDLVYKASDCYDLIWERMKDTAQDEIEALHQKKMG